MSSLDNIIRCLELGICPPQLCYTNQPEEEIDWNRVAYNCRYHETEFYEKKWAPELHNLPAFDKIIDLIVDKNKENSPLKEIIERSEKAEEIYIDKEYKDDDTPVS